MTSQDRVRTALAELGLPADLTRFDATTHTAQDAATAVGCALGQIVKTLFFVAEGRATMALVAGDRQVDTALLAQLLGVGRKRLKMGSPDEVLEYTGYPVGGVAPVGTLKPCDLVVDESLKRFARIWAAAGDSNTVFPADPLALVKATNGQWAAVTRAPA